MTRETKTKPKPKAKKAAAAPKPTVAGAIKSLADLMKASEIPRPLQYAPELAWIFALRFLDECETREATEAEAQGMPFTPTLAAPFRWQDWAAPDAPTRSGKKSRVAKFVQQSLLPVLKALKNKPNATPRQRVVSEIVSGVEHSRIEPEANLLEVLDTVHELGRETVDESQLFSAATAESPLAQVFDGLLLKMGGKLQDGAQFFTPPAVVHTMVRMLALKAGNAVYDPACGTGGFLVAAAAAMPGGHSAARPAHVLRGRENDAAMYSVALANLLIHGITEPRLLRGGIPSTAAPEPGAHAPDTFDGVLANLSHAAPDEKDALVPDDSRAGVEQMLRHVLQSLHAGSRCALILDDLVLRDTQALVPVKHQLLEECDVHCIVTLPAGMLPSADPTVRTNLVFLEKGRPTERTWYYALPEPAAGKKIALAASHFEEFFRLLPERPEGERSWTSDLTARCQAAFAQARPDRETANAANARAAALENAMATARETDDTPPDEIHPLEEPRKAALHEAREAEARAVAIENTVYDLRAVNPHRYAADSPGQVDNARVAQLLVTLEDQGREVDGALARLRALLGKE